MRLLKNHESVTVIVSPGDYRKVIEEIKEKGNVSPETRLELAKKVFVHTAHYDAMISNYLTSMKGNDVSTRTKFPESLTRQWVKVQDLQCATAKILIRQPPSTAKEHVAPGLLAGYDQLQGKELSYNNIADCDAAWEAVRSFDSPGLRDHQTRQPLRCSHRCRTPRKPMPRRSSATRPPPSAASSPWPSTAKV